METWRDVMKSDNTSKSKIWEQGKKAKGEKRRSAHTHTHAQILSELTSILHCCNWASRIIHASVQKKTSLRRQRIKCEEQKNTSICFVQKNLSYCDFCGIVSLTLPCYTSDVIHQKWQMWHDSSAWEAAVGYRQKTTYSTMCDRGKFVKTKPHI